MSVMKDEVIQAALRILIPPEILESFDLEKIEEDGETTRIFYLVEKESQIPETDEPLMKDGYMRQKDIVHFPSGLKRSILRLKRRRWVSRTDKSKCFYNKYTFTEDEMKITREYGTFLKEIGDEAPL